MKHIPVLLDEVLTYLDPQKGSTVMDMTVGAGGHFSRIASMVGDQGKMIGVDRDPMCIQNIQNLYPQHTYIHGSWTDALEKLGEEIQRIDGVLIDCGISSMQLDTPARGFSFRFDAPLDMRMDTTQELTAYEYLQNVEESDLADVLYQYADERRSRRIAKSIINARGNHKLNTTFELVEAVLAATGPKKGKTNPATKTFQAIRIKVNQELEEVKNTLTYLLNNLSKDARVVVITFHSLEDRLVKNIFRDAYKEKKVMLLHKKALSVSRAEYLENPRSRSAKVRSVQIR